MLIWRHRRLELLYELFHQKFIAVYITPEILRELTLVLGYPKLITPLARAKLTPEEILKTVTNHCVLIIPPHGKFAFLKDDPSDDKFLRCAFSARADFIVSGDQHLLKLKSFRGIPILRPAQFISRIMERKPT